MQLSLSNSLVVPSTRSLSLATIFETAMNSNSAPQFAPLDEGFGVFTKAVNTQTAFGSTTYMGLGSSANANGWVHDKANTTSTITGPTGAHSGGFNTLGDNDATANDSSISYLQYESSAASGASATYSNALGQGGSGAIRAIRSPQLDFSEFDSVELTMFVHCFGTPFGHSATGIGVAVTTDENSSSSAAEAGSGLGFTSRTAGGATFKIMQDNSLTDEDSTHTNQVRIGSQGQIQTASEQRYRYATADLSAAAGQSSVYIWLAFFSIINAGSGSSSTAHFRQDAAVDSFQIRGFK